jgi:small-conductance mechanosensitive channel
VLLEAQWLGLRFLVTFLLLPAFIVLDRIGERLILLAAPAPEALEAPRGDKPCAAAGAVLPERYAVAFQRILRLCLTAAFVVWLLAIWGVPLPFEGRAASAVIEILIILFAAHLVWEYVKAKIAAKLAESEPAPVDGPPPDEEFGQVGARNRAQTLLPLLQKAVGLTLAVMATMLVLAAIGVNIGPLLAGAGVIGLAVGFGAQTLVRDIVSGIFYLIDDAFRVGDYIEAGGANGSVENISIRTIRLRHPRGHVQFIPFSAIGKVSNYNRGPIIVKFNLRLPVDTKVSKVKKIIKKVGKEMLKDEEFGPFFTKQLKGQGIKDVEDSALIYRVKFTALPPYHFLIKREAFSRIHVALRQEGISFAHRKVTVEMPDEFKAQPPAQVRGSGDGDGPAPNPSLAGAAAAGLASILADEEAGPGRGG